MIHDRFSGNYFETIFLIYFEDIRGILIYLYLIKKALFPIEMFHVYEN